MEKEREGRDTWTLGLAGMRGVDYLRLLIQQT